MANELKPEDCWEDPMFYCNKKDSYDGRDKIFPARHGPDCPGHKDWTRHLWTSDPDKWPLPQPDKWWGYSDEIVNVDPRYL